jgi:hypothetical protein
MKKISLFIILFIFLLGASSLVFAADSTSKLKDTITNGFNWVLGISSVIAGISFAVGAVQFAISHANGRERMFGSVLGLVLLFGAYVIMQTINPKITELKLQALPAGPGLFYVKGNEKAPMPSQEPVMADVLKLGYTQFTYECLGDKDLATPLMVRIYMRPNYEDEFGRPMARAAYIFGCGTKISLSFVPKGGSFKADFMTTGVYFYQSLGCKGAVTDVKRTSGTLKDEAFAPKSFQLYYGAPTTAKKVIEKGSNIDNMGIIIHTDPDLNFGGICSKAVFFGPTVESEGSVKAGCYNIESGVNPGAFDLFYMPQNRADLGAGVDFYSQENGWNSLQAAGVFKVDNKKITEHDKGIELSSLDMVYNYSVTNRDSAYQQQFKTFKDKQGSIQIKGNYLVAIYSRAASSTKYWCQTFKDNVEALELKSAIDPNFLNDVKNSKMFVDIYEAKPQ